MTHTEGVCLGGSGATLRLEQISDSILVGGGGGGTRRIFLLTL